MAQTKQIIRNTQIHSVTLKKSLHFKDPESGVFLGFRHGSLFKSENILKIFVPLALLSWSSTPDKLQLTFSYLLVCGFL